MSTEPETSKTNTLFSIGHSNYPLEVFLGLLQKHQIEVIVDVRSNPYSRYATHFTGPFLKKSLQEKGFKYVFLGAELGGKPKEDCFYDNDGFVDYSKLACSQKFLQGLERLKHGVSNYRVAIMCGEEDPSGCHRHLLVSKMLDTLGIEVKHIRKDGSTQSYKELCLANKSEAESSVQLSIFAGANNTEFESARANAEMNEIWKSQSRIRQNE